MPLKRIGILAPPWPIPPKAYGGVEVVLDGLCRGLAASGLEVYLWSHPESTCPVRRGSLDTPYKQANAWHGSAPEMRHVRQGYEWLSHQGLDLVHDHTYVGPLVGHTLISAPIVATNWLPFYKPASGQTFPDLSEIYQAISHRMPVLAVSHGQAARAQGVVSKVIHAGTNVDDVTAGPGIGDEHGEYLAFLGRMAPEKGVSRAAALARAAGIRLKIAARMQGAAEREYFHNEVEPFLDGHQIQFVGELDWHEKTELLRNAVALLNPITWEEPFGLVMIEALAAGTPVIASKGGSVEEIVAHGLTGAICSSDKEFRAAIRARSSYSRHASRERAERLFSYATMTTNHIRFYEEVLGSSGDGIGTGGDPGVRDTVSL